MNTLSSLYPSIFKIARDKDVMVGDYWHQEKWRMVLIRNTGMEQASILNDLKSLLNNIILENSIRDLLEMGDHRIAHS